MSYFIVDENTLTDNQELINMEENNIAKKKRNHQGQLNPHYNKPHSDKAKAAISAKQRQRYEMLRQIVDKKTVTEERVKEIIQETIADYIKNETNPVETNKRPIDIRL